MAGPAFAKIKTAIDAQHVAFEAFTKRQESRLDCIDDSLTAITGRVEAIESRATSPGKTAPKAPPAVDRWIDRKSGAPVPVLAHKDLLADEAPNETGVTVGRWLRGVLTGKHSDDPSLQEAKALATTPDASGGYTVPAPLAREFIDLLRAKMVLSRVGARTLPMTSKTLTLAKLAGDATVSWHAENAAITASDPTFDAVTLDAKTIVAVTKLSLELSQDSLNVEEMITRSLTQAMALQIDTAGLRGDGTGNSPSGVTSFTGRGQVTGVGTLTNYDPFIDGLGLLLDANVPEDRIGPTVVSPGTKTRLMKLKTGIASDQTTLTPPPGLPPFVTTTTASDLTSPLTSTAFMGDWGDLLFGVRQDITVRVISEAFLAGNLQIAVLCYARVDFAAAREQSFATLEGIAG